MENKKKKPTVDYAAIIREYEMYGRGRSLKKFCEDNKENAKRLTIDSKNDQKASDNYIASLNKRIEKLTNMLKATQLSETEAKWLARYHHRQQFKRLLFLTLVESPINKGGSGWGW